MDYFNQPPSPEWSVITEQKTENQRAPILQRVSLFWKNPEYFFWMAALLAFVLFLKGETPTMPVAVRDVVTASAPLPKNPYDETKLLAQAAVVYDLKSKRTLFAKNEEMQLPLASLTKLMTAATALSLIPETTLITIPDVALKEEGDTGLRPGEVWLLRDLLKVMLIESSNDAAYAISGAVGAIAKGTEDLTAGREFFIERMNKQARIFGLFNTYFLNETGLDVDVKTAGGLSSAKEVALLLAAVLTKSPLIFSATKWGELTLENSNGDTHTSRNTNKDTDKFPLLIASKTGYTDLAGGNLLIAFDAGFNYPIIISVLGSTVEGRFTDAEKLLWATLLYLTNNK